MWQYQVSTTDRNIESDPTMNNMRHLREIFLALSFEPAALVVLFAEIDARLVFDWVDLPVAV